MLTVNPFYASLQDSYLFQKISRIVTEYKEKHSDAHIISLGIGDVTRPLPPIAVDALRNAVDEMAEEATFRGYGPEQGYEFLRKAIAECDFQSKLLPIRASEIFVSDGAKCDTGNFQELFAQDIKVAIPDPVYPVYLDTNVMAGRAGSWKKNRYEHIVYLPATKENAYLPEPPKEHVDLLYLCFPNNPTGAVATKEHLARFVAYAQEHDSLILFDAAYESFIRDPNIPHSIYEIEGARECAIEFRSLSKSAGFTGLRCAYTVVPQSCIVRGKDGTDFALNDLWARRQGTKFNGVAYPIQKAAEAIYSPAGQAQVRGLTDFYLKNARIIRSTLEECSLHCAGGIHSPYIWVDTEEESWQFFSRLLAQAEIVATPGDGFGPSGKGYIRFSAFNRRDLILEAAHRLRKALI